MKHNKHSALLAQSSVMQVEKYFAYLYYSFAVHISTENFSFVSHVSLGVICIVMMFQLLHVVFWNSDA